MSITNVETSVTHHTDILGKECWCSSKHVTMFDLNSPKLVINIFEIFYSNIFHHFTKCVVNRHPSILYQVVNIQSHIQYSIFQIYEMLQGCPPSTPTRNHRISIRRIIGESNHHCIDHFVMLNSESLHKNSAILLATGLIFMLDDFNKQFQKFGFLNKIHFENIRQYLMETLTLLETVTVPDHRDLWLPISGILIKYEMSTSELEQSLLNKLEPITILSQI